MYASVGVGCGRMGQVGRAGFVREELGGVWEDAGVEGRFEGVVGFCAGEGDGIAGWKRTVVLGFAVFGFEREGEGMREVWKVGLRIDLSFGRVVMVVVVVVVVVGGPVMTIVGVVVLWVCSGFVQLLQLRSRAVIFSSSGTFFDCSEPMVTVLMGDSTRLESSVMVGADNMFSSFFWYDL
jgi:hypothetical protein